MNWGDIQQYLIGGGGLIAIISLIGTFKDSRGKSRMDMVDRLYKEIERMDQKVAELEDELKLKNDSIKELSVQLGTKEEQIKMLTEERRLLEQTVLDLRQSINAMKEDIRLLKGEK